MTEPMSDPSMTVVPMDTHLLDWLPGAYAHCKYGSQDWCESYFNNAVEVLQSQASLLTKQADDIERLTRERDAYAQSVKDLGGIVRHNVSRAETDKARIAVLEAALTRSRIALDDWLNTYAADHCKPDRVKEAWERIGLEGGTLAYIAFVQEQNRNALETP